MNFNVAVGVRLEGSFTGGAVPMPDFQRPGAPEPGERNPEGSFFRPKAPIRAWEELPQEEHRPQQQHTQPLTAPKYLAPTPVRVATGGIAPTERPHVPPLSNSPAIERETLQSLLLQIENLQQERAQFQAIIEKLNQPEIRDKRTAQALENRIKKLEKETTSFYTKSTLQNLEIQALQEKVAVLTRYIRPAPTNGEDCCVIL